MLREINTAHVYPLIIYGGYFKFSLVGNPR